MGSRWTAGHCKAAFRLGAWWFFRATRNGRQLTVSRTGLEVVTFSVLCHWQRWDRPSRIPLNPPKPVQAHLSRTWLFHGRTMRIRSIRQCVTSLFPIRRRASPWAALVFHVRKPTHPHPRDALGLDLSIDVGSLATLWCRLRWCTHVVLAFEGSCRRN
ncbi:hypothetical protein FKP32DRAFT_426560 [Trametes sanguinea]|nr:hypothetical protein FKP32DRAFT_426560 [Trametes sanguinea]